MIIVGVDGSAAALQAVTWAAREAVLREVRLRIAHVLPTWAQEMPETGRYAEVGRWMRQGAADVLAQASERAHRSEPEVDAETVCLAGDPRDALAAAAGEAELLVLGNHGQGGFTGLLVGSVALAMAGHSPCDVVVVRQTPALPRAEVVVGVDGAPGENRVLAFAFAEAELRGVDLRAVHAWLPMEQGGAAQDEAGEERLLAEALAGQRGLRPEVKVIEQVVQGHPADVLRQASAGADLLVVGSTGHRGFAGLVLGSVSQAMLHHAACPLAVVRVPHR